MSQNKDMSFWEHLDEFRSRIFIVLAFVLIGSIITYSYCAEIIEILLLPSKSYSGISFQVIRITSMLMINLGLSLFGGFIIGLPVLVYQIIRFLSPAVKIELKWMIILVFFSFIFFISGALFAYKVIIPFLLQFFTSITIESVDVSYNFTLDSYLSYTLWTIFINGIIFLMPIFSIIGSKSGILTPEFLKHYRKHSFIAFLVISALITPPDPFSQILIVIPFFILYELSIILSRFISK